MPFSAPIPVPTITAVGVANPNAQGQAIIKTAIKMVRAKRKPLPAISQTPKASIPITTTAGTK